MDLKTACDAVVNDPALVPNDGRTYCDVASQTVAHLIGCDELVNQTADQMYVTMAQNKSKRWKKVDGISAVTHALNGGLGFATLTSHQLKEAHGHIAVIYPEVEAYSGSWGKNVPIVANVGKNNGIMKVSLAFPVKMGEPDYFIWS